MLENGTDKTKESSMVVEKTKTQTNNGERILNFKKQTKHGQILS